MIAAEEEAAILKHAKDEAMSIHGPPSWAATRQLKKWGVEPGAVEHDTFVRLYMSIREVCGANVKISQNMLQGFKHKLSRTASLKRKLWMVPTDNPVETKRNSGNSSWTTATLTSGR